ncbi:hypothetical protein J6590_090525 [Homalodisca vitripennis]|nr:hypothetical protein J6590_090525 [Homalodisca vitripennis]
MVTQVLRCGNPFMQLNYLKELQQLTAIIARSTNQEVARVIREGCGDRTIKLESTSHFHKIKNLMLALLSRFVLSESVLKDLASSADPDRNNRERRADVILTFMQISGNLVMYARNLISSCGLDKPATSVILQPYLIESNVLNNKGEI